MQWQLLSDFQRTGYISDSDAEANDQREAIVNGVYLVAQIVTIVIFIQWFRRAYFNLHLRGRNLRYTEGWAAGAWFIPIFSLFAPYNIFKDLITESKRILQNKGIPEPVGLSIKLLNVYWLFWVVGSIIANVSFRMSVNDNSANSLIKSTVADLISSILIFISGFLLISIIKRYNQIEPLLEDTQSEIDKIGEAEKN